MLGYVDGGAGLLPDNCEEAGVILDASAHGRPYPDGP
jgi:hypothetical protein